jgi:hypothetical protein
MTTQAPLLHQSWNSFGGDFYSNKPYHLQLTKQESHVQVSSQQSKSMLQRGKICQSQAMGAIDSVGNYVITTERLVMLMVRYKSQE